MDTEPNLSYEILEESYERVFEELDNQIAEDKGLRNKDVFIDAILVDGIKYNGKQHVNLRDRDEDVYEISSPAKFKRRIHLYTASDTEILADNLVTKLQGTIGAAPPPEVTTYHISPAPRTNVIDKPQRGDVLVYLHDRHRGFPITSFLVHQSQDISEQCKNVLDFIKKQ